MGVMCEVSLKKVQLIVTNKSTHEFTPGYKGPHKFETTSPTRALPVTGLQAGLWDLNNRFHFNQYFTLFISISRIDCTGMRTDFDYDHHISSRMSFNENNNICPYMLHA